MDLSEKLSENFTFGELTRTSHRSLLNDNRRLACAEDVKENLINLAEFLLEHARKLNGGPLFITSGFRCEMLNRMVKGSRTSQHMKGCAADVFIPGCYTQEDIRKFAFDLADTGIEFGQLLVEPGPVLHMSLPNGYNDGEIAFYDPDTGKKKVIKYKKKEGMA